MIGTGTFPGVVPELYLFAKSFQLKALSAAELALYFLEKAVRAVIIWPFAGVAPAPANPDGGFLGLGVLLGQN
jgi:hypothetical protein